ncbi:cytochrome P450 2U1 [Caerostris darwini]|uniref:Cytochrome P450 2U1 n=1 Tax=Caerostris darwini TaxID=1538125 RepID=A0AAV4USF0_9ARAC|nr:cytochrome P450 2U1 [Caerostris darwini]
MDLHLAVAYTFNCIISRVLFNRKFDIDRTFSRNLKNMSYMVEIFTGVRHMLVGFPFTSAIALFGRSYKKGRDALQKFTDDVVDDKVKKFDPNHPDCYVDEYLRQRNELLKKNNNIGSFTDERLKANAMTLFFEGTESSSSTIVSLLLELTKHPDVQKKIQQELDSVVGRERLPSWLDKPNLPYLDATLQELYRFGSLFLVTTMYSNFKETTIEGYKIPKRSVIVSNLYSIHFDPKLYPNPETFEPKRFLNDEGKRIKVEGPFLFGLGKRACIGESLAQMEIFLVISSLLQSFTMPHAKDTRSFRLIPRE